jgi:serine/threonine protein kinase
MGGYHSKSDFELLNISKGDFEFLRPIGRGSIGKVWRVFHKQTKKHYAVKTYKKQDIPSREVLISILKERALLSILSHPFIVNINFAYQDSNTLYLGLDLKSGGDLRYHMLKHKFNESEIKFIIGCVLQSLTYLHSVHVLHQDVKPENIVLDTNGYAFLTDFGTAALMKSEYIKEHSGSPGYIAPEVLFDQNHTFVSDFFALGVIIYENMMRTRPFLGKNRDELKEEIVTKKIKLLDKDVPKDWSLNAADICNHLLKINPERRLGFNGIKEIINHPWFKDLDQKSLKNFKLKPPFIPIGSENFDRSYVNQSIKIEKKNKSKLKKNDFVGYSYISGSLLKK